MFFNPFDRRPPKPMMPMKGNNLGQPRPMPMAPIPQPIIPATVQPMTQSMSPSLDQLPGLASPDQKAAGNDALAQAEQQKAKFRGGF